MEICWTKYNEFIFGGAYVRMEICVSKSIGLACSGKEIYHFCFVFLCIRGQILSTSPPGCLYSEGRFNGGFFALRFWGAYFRNFTVFAICTSPIVTLVCPSKVCITLILISPGYYSRPKRN